MIVINRQIVADCSFIAQGVPPGNFSIPASTIHRANVGLMLGHRLRRWPNIKPTLAQCIVFAGINYRDRSTSHHSLWVDTNEKTLRPGDHIRILCLKSPSRQEIMLIQFWARVRDDCPTLYQNWIRFSC